MAYVWKTSYGVSIYETNTSNLVWMERVIKFGP